MGTNQAFFTAMPGEANLDSYEGQGSLQNQWGKIATREEPAEKQRALTAFYNKGLEIEKPQLTFYRHKDCLPGLYKPSYHF